MENESIRIKKVKFTNSGLRGLVVEYEKVTMKEDREFRNEHKDILKAPVHYELEKWMQALKKDLLDICGYDDGEDNRKVLMNNLEVSGVTAGEGSFVIVGKMRVLGAKTINLVTPNIKEDDECEGYESVMNIVKAIYQETMVYMEGNSVMEDEQLVIKFNSGKNDFSESEFMAMSKEDKKRIATEILEKQGSIVIHNEEMDEAENEPKEEKDVQPAENKPAESDIEIEVDFDLMGNGKVKVVGPVIANEEEDEFQLVGEVGNGVKETDDDDFELELQLEPEIKSTAKRAGE